MTEVTDERHGAVRVVAGLVLIFAAAPVFIWLSPGHKGWVVIIGGLAALGVIVAGVVLAGHWLGVFRRRRVGSVEQQGCLPLLVTLVTLVAVAAILYYLVYYGAGVALLGEP